MTQVSNNTCNATCNNSSLIILSFYVKIWAFLAGAVGRTLGLAVPVVKRFVRDIVNPQKKMSTVLDIPTEYRQKNWLAPQRNVTVSKRIKISHRPFSSKCFEPRNEGEVSYIVFIMIISCHWYANKQK